MAEFRVAETFLSINGEGPLAGQLAFFIRFTGCNLRCSYCDTRWASQPDTPYTLMTEDDLYLLIQHSGVKNVTITGGEPLLQRDIRTLLSFLCRDPRLSVEVETNGSILLSSFMSIPARPSFTMDYKLPGSGMENEMCTENLLMLGKKDTVKFVCGSMEDLYRAQEVIMEYGLLERTRVYLSPVFGQLDPADMVEFMKANRLNDVNLQLQIHKFIWDPDKKGV